MKLAEVLDALDPEGLQRLARIALRGTAFESLPLELLRDELADVLKSPSYISEALSRRQPPAHAILRALLAEPMMSLPLHDFKQRIDDETAILCERVDAGSVLLRDKQYDLYRRVMSEAWKSGLSIDPSEAALLAVLRRELDINHQEHVLVQYHQDLTQFWRNERAFDRERAGLAISGLVFTREGRCVLPDEVAIAVRDVLEIPLGREALKRLYASMQNADLGAVLKDLGLRQSGSKEERIETLLANPVSPFEVLRSLNLVEALRPLAKNLYCATNGSKEELIDSVIEHLSHDGDLVQQARLSEAAQAPPAKKEVEQKTLAASGFKTLFGQLTNEELYEVLSAFEDLKRSGTKDARVETLLASPYAETTLLKALTNRSLSNVLDRLRLRTSGPKDEKIDRLVEYARSARSVEALQVDGQAESQVAPDAVALVPKQLASVRERFGFLDHDQATVLAVLGEMQSLSDLELDQVTANHNLSWMFVREEMRRLMHLLNEKGMPVIERRESGEHDVYVYRGQL